MAMSRKSDYEVAENIAAIALAIGASSKRVIAYEAAADSMGGFTGFYQISILMGKDLEQYIRRHRITWGDQVNWIPTTESLVDNLLNFMIQEKRLPADVERTRLIKASLTLM